MISSVPVNFDDPTPFDDDGKPWPDDIDPETGLRNDGAWCNSKRQHDLAVEQLRLQFQLDALAKEIQDVEKSNPRDAALMGDAISKGYRKLTEIQRQQREENDRLNKLRFG